MTPEDLLRRTYAAFNARDLDAALAGMHPSVAWPNGMEGGMIYGHRGIREYWNRQWRMVNPHVELTRFVAEADGKIDVHVHQVVCDLAGNVLMDKFVQHVYHFEDGLIRSMEIRDA